MEELRKEVEEMVSEAHKECEEKIEEVKRTYASEQIDAEDILNKQNEDYQEHNRQISHLNQQILSLESQVNEKNLLLESALTRIHSCD